MGPSLSYITDNSDYDVPEEGDTAFPEGPDVMSNITRLSQGDRAYKNMEVKSDSSS